MWIRESKLERVVNTYNFTRLSFMCRVRRLIKSNQNAWKTCIMTAYKGLTYYSTVGTLDVIRGDKPFKAEKLF
jgi:hypothetical protein